MTDFRPEPGSSVFFRTDFTFQPVANIDFHDAAWQRVPFHLSLRPREGRVVVNRRDAAGWRREIVLDHPLDPAGGTAELRFHAGAVTVWLDGQRLARFDRFPRPDRQGRLFLRRGFPDLAEIAHVTVEGAVLQESLRLRSPADRLAPAALRVQPGGHESAGAIGAFSGSPSFTGYALNLCLVAFFEPPRETTRLENALMSGEGFHNDG